MSFYVVEFLAGKEVAVISHAWYMGNNLAAWPLMKPSKFKSLLRNHILPPADQYKILEIVILKKTDDYSRAVEYEKRAEYELNFTSTEANPSVEKENKKRKRFIKRHSSSGDSEPSTPKKIKKHVMIESPFQYPKLDATNACSRSTMASSSKSISSHSTSIKEQPMKYSMPSEEHEVSMRQLFDKETANEKTLQILLSKMVVIEEFVKIATACMKNSPLFLHRTDELSDSHNKGYNFKFPVTCKAMYLQLNAELVDKSCFQSIVDVLSHIHRGNCIQQCVRRIASFVFCKSFATELNWIGANGKNALANTPIATAIISAARSSFNYPHESVGSCVHCLQRWLHCASDRNGGRAKRKIEHEKSNVDLDAKSDNEDTHAK